MPALAIIVPTPDGDCAASLHTPTGTGPWPAVIVHPDAAGVRDTFRVMADRLAALGYVVLLPDVHHRNGGYAPFNATTVFGDPAERQLVALAGSVTVILAGAENDGSFTPEHREHLERASVGVRHTVEIHPAVHGFAVPDNATHDPAADERHWAATADLFATLPRP